MLVTGIRGWGQTSRIFLAIKAIRGSANTLSLPNSQTICQQRLDLKSRPEGKKLTQSKIRIPYKVHIPCISIWEVIFRWCSFASFFDRAPFLSSEVLVSIYWGIYHDQIQYPSQTHGWDVHFWHRGDLWPLVSRTLKTRATVFYPMVFAVFLNAKKIKPPVESPFLCQNHMELTSPTHPTKSLPRTQTWQVPLNVDF